MQSLEDEEEEKELQMIETRSISSFNTAAIEYAPSEISKALRVAPL